MFNNGENTILTSREMLLFFLKRKVEHCGISAEKGTLSLQHKQQTPENEIYLVEMEPAKRLFFHFTNFVVVGCRLENIKWVKEEPFGVESVMALEGWHYPNKINCHIER